MPKSPVFLVGAGASFVGPSLLPMFGQMRASLATWMKLPTSGAPASTAGNPDITGSGGPSPAGADQGGLSIAEKVKIMPPEVFMQCVRLGGAPLNDWVAGILGAGEPNAVHAVLAWALDHGASIWSLNVDELIESVPSTADESAEAAHDRRAGIVASRRSERGPEPEPPPARSARLYKPHGTLSRRNFIFRTDQVLYPLPPSWADRLLEEVEESGELVAIGYAGADIDMRSVLAQAIETASTVRWFVLDEEAWNLTCDSLPGLRRHRGLDRVLSRYENPSHDFLDWADQLGLADYVTPYQRAEIDHTEWTTPAPPAAPSRASRAYLYERMSEPELAAADFWTTVRQFPPTRLQRRAAVRLAKLHWYAQARRGGLWRDGSALVRDFDRHVLGHGPRWAIVPKLRRAHIMWLSSVAGDHETALLLARTAREDDPATFIVRAKALRYIGQTVDALAAGERAYELAVPADPKRIPRPDEAAHSVFEQVYALIWLGRLAEAKARMGALYAGLDGQAAARWIGWSRYLRGGISLLRHNEDDAQSKLEEAQGYFVSDDDEGRRGMACKVLLHAVARMKGAQPEVVDVPDGALPVMSQLRATALIEQAESARACQAFDAASAIYRTLSDRSSRPYLSTAALIALAEIEISHGRHPDELLSRARRQAEHAGYVLLQAELLVTEARAGVRTEDEAIVRLAELSDDLPPKHFTDLRRLIREPEDNHPLYCVW